MSKTTSHYIGPISIQSLRYFIIDKKLPAEDTILLHQVDFDEIALEYKETYNATLPTPYVLLGVLVYEDTSGSVPKGRVVVAKGDNKLAEYSTLGDGFPTDDEIIYRCGWCGNVVNFDGALLGPQTRTHKIKILETYRHKIFVKKVHGACCPDGEDL